MPKKVFVGVVTSDKMAKTRIVQIPRVVRHAKYGKYLRRRTVCYVHDEGDAARTGDTVEIVESRPRSRTKRWELVRVIERSGATDLADLRRREEQLDSEIVASGADAAGADAAAQTAVQEAAQETQS
jgi:small subunit ribosomal protein S17